MNETSLFSNRKFLRIFASYSISMFGIYFDRIAIILMFAYLWDEGPLMLALIPIAFALPQVLFGQFAGILTDRLPKVPVMMTADLLSALLTLILAFTTQPWLCIVILAVRSTLAVVHYPAQQSLMKAVVHPDHMLKAVSLNGTVSQLSKIVGPLVGGTIAGVYAPNLCILINGAALFLSAMMIFGLRRDEGIVDSTGANAKTPVWKAWREGWSVVIRTRMLFLSFTVSFFGFLVVQMVDVQFPILFRTIAPSQPELVGWLMSFTGVGALIMIMILIRMKNLRHMGLLLGLGMALIAAGFGGSSFLEEGFHRFNAFGLALLLGLGVGLHTIVTQYTLQMFSTPETIGRVSSMYSSLMSLSILTAPICGAFLVEQFSVASVLQATAVGLLVLGSLSLVMDRRMRKTTKRHQHEETSGLQAN
ncbi:MFS transporter [Paenibacillus campinasensis]|uniref:MFS transporter n=1 Tax=Paenibacillus campinasensis TaxID=66347 RepID=A0ABW9SZV0_9BACL|nr:MFS transporter [Paenibacillus campinasensis]MUG65816.1 MFS transporter [Paenibacillus campinasensis]